MADLRRWAMLLLMALTVACGAGAEEKKTMPEYKWLPSESAPRDAPIFFVRGEMQLADGNRLYVPDQRIAHKGWGEVGSTHLVGPEIKALPRQVSLTWFSFVENRFYSGQFTLPTDRIAALFDRGTPAPPPRGRETYDRVIFGMAPGGNVSVWASTGRVTTEVATFKAQPADVPWSEVVEDPAVSRDSYIQETLAATLGEGAAAATRPERVQAWNDYPRRLAWAPQLAGTAPQGATVWTKGLNGEKDWVDLADATRGGEPLPPTLPMPAALTLSWRTTDGSRMAEITFDALESVAAFKKLSTADRPGAMTLMLEPSPTGETVDMFLRRGELAYRFKNTKVEVFGGD